MPLSKTDEDKWHPPSAGENFNPKERLARQHCLGGRLLLRAQLGAIQGMVLFPISVLGEQQGLGVWNGGGGEAEKKRSVLAWRAAPAACSQNHQKGLEEGVVAPLPPKQTHGHGAWEGHLHWYSCNHSDAQFSRKNSNLKSGRGLGEKNLEKHVWLLYSPLPPFLFPPQGLFLFVTSPWVHFSVQPFKPLHTKDAGWHRPWNRGYVPEECLSLGHGLKWSSLEKVMWSYH